MESIGQQVWHQAERFFAQHPKAHSFKLPNQKLSIIKLEGQNYLLDNVANIGAGNYGIVNIIYNQSGERFAIKVEQLPNNLSRHEEQAILNRLGELEQVVVQPLAKDKQFKDDKGRKIVKKVYTVMRLKEGEKLEHWLNRHNNLTSVDKLRLALCCALEVQRLHSHDILHGDLKPENLIIQIKSNIMKVITVDYGFGLRLFGLKEISFYKHRGSPKYMAPELNPLYLYRLRRYRRGDLKKKPPRPEKLPLFSKATDVYALAILLQKDLQLGDLPNKQFKEVQQLLRQMKHHDSKSRPKIETVVQTLYRSLKRHVKNSEHIDIDEQLALVDQQVSKAPLKNSPEHYSYQQRKSLFIGATILSALAITGASFALLWQTNWLEQMAQTWRIILFVAIALYTGLLGAGGILLALRYYKTPRSSHDYDIEQFKQQYSISKVWEEMRDELPEIFPKTIEELLEQAAKYGVHFDNKQQVGCYLLALRELINSDYQSNDHTNIFVAAAKRADII